MIRTVNPVCSEVDELAGGKCGLVDTSTDSISSLKNSDIEAMLQENIGATKTCDTCTNNTNRGMLRQRNLWADLSCVSSVANMNRSSFPKQLYIAF